LQGDVGEELLIVCGYHHLLPYDLGPEHHFRTRPGIYTYHALVPEKGDTFPVQLGITDFNSLNQAIYMSLET
jgi:hypothetical protein